MVDYRLEIPILFALLFLPITGQGMVKFHTCMYNNDAEDIQTLYYICTILPVRMHYWSSKVGGSQRQRIRDKLWNRAAMQGRKLGDCMWQ